MGCWAAGELVMLGSRREVDSGRLSVEWVGCVGECEQTVCGL